MDGFKRSRFPAFGNWDYSDGVPMTTTHYFDYAAETQQAHQAAGFIPFTFGYEDFYATASTADFFTDDNVVSIKPVSIAKTTKTKGSEKKKHCRHGYIKEPRKQGRVCDVPQQQHGVHLHAAPKPKPKPVDEDLYKIPPELLYRQSKRKKILGFFSRCLVPTCAQ